MTRISRPPHISPSILAADTMRLGELVAAVEAAGAHSIHVDVMDGHYVDNLAFSPKTIADLRQATQLPLHAHLEVANPNRCAPLFAGADLIIVQEDTCPDLQATLARIRALGCQAGVGVNPGRPVEPLAPLLPQIDLVLLLAVEPGFGGQAFDAAVLAKTPWLLEQRERQGLSFHIGIDGGVGVQTVPRIAAAGVDFFVAGTAVFGGGATVDVVGASVRQVQALAMRRPD